MQDPSVVASGTRGSQTGPPASTLSSGDGRLSGQYAWRLDPTPWSYAWCNSSGECGFPGKVEYTARINLSGRGTGDLVQTLRVLEGSDVDVTFDNTCDEKGQGGCGERGHVAGRAPADYNFARAGEGYFFADAANYDIDFLWTWDPVEGPDGTVASPWYNSWDFTCPTDDEPCFFPEW